MIILVCMALVWSGIGFLVARYGLKIRELLILLPVSMGSGIVLQVWLLNIFLKLFDTSLASWLVTVLGIVVGSVLYWRSRAQVRPLQLGCSPRTGIVLLLLWVVTAIGVYNVVASYSVFDEVDHGPRATMIAQTGLSTPTRSYANPDYCMFYHYAENAAVGTLSRQTGILDLKRLTDYRTAFNMTAVVGLCFAFLWSLLKRQQVGFALLGTFLFVMIGPMHGFASLPLFDYLPDGNAADYVEFVAMQANGDAEPYPYPADLMVPLIRYMETPNPPGFWVAGFLALLVWRYVRSDNRVGHLALGLLVAHTAVYFETGLPLIAVPIGLSLVYRLWQSRHSFLLPLQNLLLYSIPAFVALSLQGGVITDTLLCEPLGDVYAEAWGLEGTSLMQFGSNEGLSYQGGYYSRLHGRSVEVWNPGNLPILLIDWGLGFFLYPVVLIYMMAKRQFDGSLILATGLAMIIFAALFKNSITSANNYRIAVLPLWMGGALSIFMWRDIWKWHIAGKLIVVAGVVLLTFTSMSNALWFAKQPPVPSIVLSSLDYTVQAEWMGKLDPVSDSVFDPSVDNYLAGTRGLARSIMVFGTYAHHAYHANINDLSDPRLTAWRQHLLPGDLSALGYNYLYIDQTWWNDLINLQQQRISNPQYYTLIEEWSDESSGEFRRLYQIVGQATLADQEPFVSYFSPENQNLFKEHAPSFALEPDAVIFDPRTGSSLVQKGFIMNIVEVIENTPLSSAERHALFDLIMLFDQAQFEVDLPARSDYSTQITAWRSSKLPEPLQALSIDYLLVDDEWLGWLTPEEVDILSNSSYYELVQVWELSVIGNRYFLYRVIG